MSPDITYLKTGFFTTFFSETKEGDKIYKEIIEQNGSPKILTRDLKNVLYQIKNAGYTVKKAKKPTLSIDDIFKELENF